MICINTPQKPPWNSKLSLSKLGISFSGGASIFRWTMLVFGGVHLFMFLEIENFDSECLRLVETQKEWGIFYLYLFTHVHHFFWEGAPTKSAFFGKMINKNSEAKKGFGSRGEIPHQKKMVMKSLKHSKSTRKFDHEITFNKGRCSFPQKR